MAKIPAIQSFAEFICDTRRERHPAAAIERASLAVLDTLGCILLGSGSDVARVAHRAAAGWGDAAIAVRAELGLQDIDEIESVSVSLPDFHLAVLPYHVPGDRAEALFSTAYCVATALATGGNRIEDFFPGALKREDILRLTDRVRVSGRVPKRPEFNFDPDDPDSVEVRLVNGRRARHQVAVYTGAPGRDLGRDRFISKFEDCHRYYLEAVGGSGISNAAAIDTIGLLHKAEELSHLVEVMSGAAG